MTNRVLWLLSYVGLSLALSLGSSDRLQQPASGLVGAVGGPRAPESPGLAAAPSPRAAAAAAHEQHFRRRRGTGPLVAPYHPGAEWLLYDKRAGPRPGGGGSPVLLDDVMSAVLGNYYRQRQALSDRKPPPRQPSPAYFDRDDPDGDDQDDDPEDNELRDDDDDDSADQSSPPRRGDFLEQQQQRFGLTSRPEPAPPRPPGKRNQGPKAGAAKDAAKQHAAPPAAALASAGASMASQFMMRSARGSRQYDVPQIECPLSDDGMERFACPTADRMGRYRCIDDHVLCDGFIDCPTGEDEDRQACMFYKTTKAHLDVLADALLRWARGR